MTNKSREDTPSLDKEDASVTSKKSEKDLKNTVRMAKANANKYKQYSETTLKNQSNNIEILKRDNDLLKEQIDTILRTVNIAQSVELGKRINILNEELDGLTRKIVQEEQKIKVLRHEEEELQGQILHARIDLGGVNVPKENTQMIDKQIKVLENRLDKALVKFNEALALNKELRDQIENLRQERVVFDNIYKKMEKELHEKKKEMAKIIESSNAAYEERDETQHKLATLRVVQERVMKQFDAQFKELDDLIKQDDSINEKIKLKERERKDKEATMVGSMTAEEEQALKKKVVKSNWAIAEQKAKHVVNASKVKQLEEMFKKIESATGHSVEELIVQFAAAEDSNFSLFTYVNELNSEIEKSEEQIVELDTEMKKYKGDGANSSELQRKRALVELQDHVSSVESKAEQFDSKYKSASKTIQALATGIQGLFAKLGCDGKGIAEMLGTQTVTESNMMVYLGVIEQRANDLLQVFVDDKANAGIEIGPSHPFGQTRITISPPTTGEGEDDDDDTEDDERPLTRDELLAKSKTSKNNNNNKKKKKKKF